MLFIYLYHDDLYFDLQKSDLYFRPAKTVQINDFCMYVFIYIMMTCTLTCRKVTCILDLPMTVQINDFCMYVWHVTVIQKTSYCPWVY